MTPPYRVVASALVAAIVLFFVALPASAANDEATLRVQVIDAATRRPIGLARVELHGAQTLSAYTGPDGVAIFAHPARGTYDGNVFRPGFTTATLASVVVSPEQSVEITVALASQATPQVIGTVRVRSTATPSFEAVNQSSVQQRLLGNMNDALATLPGVTARAGGAFSIDGNDSGQTAFTIDGVPVAGLRNLRGIDADLFGGVGVSSAPRAGRLGGSLGFTTLEPTIAFEGNSVDWFDSRNGSSALVGGRGTSGLVGYVFGHVARGFTGPLDALRFEDSSGLSYGHRDEAVTQTDLLKLRFPLSQTQALTATVIRGRDARDDVCTRFTSLLPCGIGPGNAQQTRTGIGVVSYSAQAGSTAFGASFASDTSAVRADNAFALLGGVATPAITEITTSGRTIDVTASGPAGRRHHLTAELFDAVQRLGFRSTGTYGASVFDRDRYSRIAVGDGMRFGDALALDANAGVDSANGRSHPSGSLAFTLTPDPRTTATLGLAFSGGGSTAAPFGIVQDPRLLNYDCARDAVVGTVPGELPRDSSGATASASINRRAGTTVFAASFTAKALYDTLVPSYVAAPDLPAGTLPAGYAGSVSTLFGSGVLGCGAGATLDPDRFFLERPAIAPVLRTNVARVAVSSPLGRSGVAAITAAYQRATDSLVPGRQLPGVPTWQGSAVADVRAPGSPLEVLLLAQYTGSGNAANLPAHTQVNAGVSMQLRRGSLTVSLLNVFGADAGAFAVSGVSSSQTLSGTSIPALSAPLRGRTVHVQYSIRFGTRAAPRTISAADVEAGDEQDLGRYALVPHAPGARDPATYFEPTITSVTCTPELLPQARTQLAALKVIVATIESRRSAQGAYPRTFEASAPPGLTVTYIPRGDTYALRIYAARRFVRPFAQCSYFTGVAGDEAAKAHIYAPDALANEDPSAVFAYAPGLGLYYVGESSSVAAAENPRFEPLPGQPPADPYALRETCPAESRPAAEQVLADLRAAADAWKSDAPPPRPSFLAAIRRHGSFRDGFLEIEPPDPAVSDGLLHCAHVAGASPERLAKEHLDAVAFPRFAFTPRFGLYVATP